VHGQTGGHAVSQRGVARGVTVTVHGQTGPPRRPRGAAEAEEEEAGAGLTEDEWAAAAVDSARAALAAGRAAMAAGDAPAAVRHFTRAVHAVAADGDDAGVDAATAYAARADARFAAGDLQRAFVDAIEVVLADSGGIESSMRCGRIAHALGKWNDAMDYFERAEAFGDETAGALADASSAAGQAAGRAKKEAAAAAAAAAQEAAT
jgi:tetratricopeptide (TPR) repeat protein